MDIEATRKIGKKLRKMRRLNGLTQEQVAKDLEKPQSYISKIESGEKSLHLYEVFPYADALKVSRADLLGEVELTLTGKRTIPPHVEYAIIDFPSEPPEE